MNFNAELINVKTMNSTGTLRITLDVPEVDVPMVMAGVSNYIKKPLLVQLAVDTSNVVNGFSKMSDGQRKLLHALYKDIATKFNATEEDIIKSAKSKFLGGSDVSTKDLSYDQASKYIDDLKGILNANS